MMPNYQRKYPVLSTQAYRIVYTVGVQLRRGGRSIREAPSYIMTIWQQLGQRPEHKVRRWQRKARVLARKATRDGHLQSILTWRVWSALLVALIFTFGLLANPTTRHWLSAAFANIAIVGGIVAAPVISLVAWIGVSLPTHAPLHQAAPTLFIGAILWMVMGFVSAHARREEPSDR